MTTAPRIAAAHLFFAREGASFSLPSAGIVGREAKPDGADASWIRACGIVEDLSITPNEEFKKLVAPVPGRRVLWDERKSMQETEIKWTAQEFSPVAVEMLLGSGALTASSTQFNPSSGSTKRFWLKCQIYDDTDALLLAFDSFGVLKADGELSFGSDFLKPKFSFKALYSTLETGVI